jgi:hypothetical protein
LELIPSTLFARSNCAIDGSSALLAVEQVIALINKGGGGVVDLKSGSINYVAQGSKSVINTVNVVPNRSKSSWSSHDSD